MRCENSSLLLNLISSYCKLVHTVFDSYVLQNLNIIQNKRNRFALAKVGTNLDQVNALLASENRDHENESPVSEKIKDIQFFMKKAKEAENMLKPANKNADETTERYRKLNQQITQQLQLIDTYHRSLKPDYQPQNTIPPQSTLTSTFKKIQGAWETLQSQFSALNKAEIEVDQTDMATQLYQRLKILREEKIKSEVAKLDNTDNGHVAPASPTNELSETKLALKKKKQHLESKIQIIDRDTEQLEKIIETAKQQLQDIDNLIMEVNIIDNQEKMRRKTIEIQKNEQQPENSLLALYAELTTRMRRSSQVAASRAALFLIQPAATQPASQDHSLKYK